MRCIRNNKIPHLSGRTTREKSLTLPSGLHHFGERITQEDGSQSKENAQTCINREIEEIAIPQQNHIFIGECGEGGKAATKSNSKEDSPFIIDQAGSFRETKDQSNE